MELDIIQQCGTECICDGPGQCPCYGVFMNDNLHGRCKRSQNWRDNFSHFFKSLVDDGIRDATEKRLDDKDLDQAMAEIEAKADGVEVEGLGDLVENVLTKFGITQERVQKALGTKDCGCSRRKQFLNKLFPFARKNDEQKKEDE